MIGIYKITNLVNGKCYIGQSVNINKRFIAHKNSAFNENSTSYNYPLSRAIRKYGLNNFSFEILEECGLFELDEKEIFYIAKYQAYGEGGYNQDPGGKQASHYVKLSDELVDQIIERLKTSLDNSDEIGEEFGVSGRTIRSINSGEYYLRENEKYPIRKSLYLLDDTGQVKKSKYYCKICGVLITKYSNYCVKCAQQMQQKSEKPEPLDLARMVKEYGFSATGKRYGVTGTTIKKWCKKYGIPYLKDELISWYNTRMGIQDIPVVKKDKAIQNKPVKQINPYTSEVLAIFESTNAAARRLGKKKGSHISEACRGVHDIVYGFKWEYV